MSANRRRDAAHPTIFPYFEGLLMNYQLALEQRIEALGGRRPPLLLHCCCAVCSSYVLEYLSRYFKITALFYNPNIWPREEYLRRKDALVRLIAAAGYSGSVGLVDLDYDHGEFLRAARGLEAQPEGGARCTQCFSLRLGRAAQEAARRGIGLVCTTLTISPHKNAQLINETGAAMASQAGVEWLPGDFKKKDGFRRAGELTAQYGLYRQNYCGCEFAMGHLAAKDNAL